MRKYTEKTVKTTVLVEVVCDCCGKVIDSEDVVELQEMLHVGFTGGYGAILGDGTSYTMDMCQECVAKVLGPYLKEVPEQPWSDEDD